MKIDTKIKLAEKMQKNNGNGLFRKAKKGENVTEISTKSPIRKGRINNLKFSKQSTPANAVMMGGKLELSQSFNKRFEKAK
jgi:hypothetical protein